MTALNTEESIVVLQTPQLTTDAGMVDAGVPPTIRGIEKLVGCLKLCISKFFLYKEIYFVHDNGHKTLVQYMHPLKGRGPEQNYANICAGLGLLTLSIPSSIMYSLILLIYRMKRVLTDWLSLFPSQCWLDLSFSVS